MSVRIHAPDGGLELRAEVIHVVDEATAAAEAMTLLHPFMPFITEELWAKSTEGNARNMLAVSPWPALSGLADAKADEEIGALIDLMTDAFARIDALHLYVACGPATATRKLR